MPNNGGPTLHHMQLVTITYNNYVYQADAENFGDWVMTSDWFTTVGADYDVHAGTHLKKVRLPSSLVAPTTISDTDVQAFIESKIHDGTLPAPGAVINGVTVTEPLYAIYYPQTTTITLDDGAGGVVQSCAGFGGYHAEFDHILPSGSRRSVSYAVMPVCPAQDGTTDLQQLTLAASHEYIEAATDPFPYHNNGYELIDPSEPWAFIPGEVGDLCYTTYYVDPSGWTVQPVWSNSAAARSATTGESPCIPWPSNQAFFDVTTTPSTVQPTGANRTATFQIQAFSDQPGVSWFVTLYAVGGSIDPTDPGLSWTMTTTAGNTDSTSPSPYVQVSNGDTGTMTVTLPASAQSNDYTFMYLYITNGVSTSFTFYPVLVYQP